MSERRVYLSPWEDRAPESELMRFRLCYEGELKATQRDPIGSQGDRLAEHKQALRRAFHKQLRELWRTDRFLSNHNVCPSDYRRMLQNPQAISDSFGAMDESVPLAEFVGRFYHESGYQFVPLVREDWSLRCALNVLLLRRDYPGSVIDAGDLDNRVKTLIDGLRRPKNATELRGNETPASDETPFFVLLEDDRLITEFTVETDTLLDQPTGNAEADRRFVRAIITVELQPYNVSLFNLAFA